MTFIHVDPSELKSNSLFPVMDNVIECPGLEAMTGCDFVISRIPVSPVIALSLHIEHRSLFCQRKSGYDALADFNQIWLEIAKMQECAIPIQLAFILPIGKFYPNHEGHLRIEGKKPIEKNKTISYKTYLKNEAAWGFSGTQVRRLNSEDELPIWIEAQAEELERIEERGSKKEVFTKPTQFLPSDDPFQEVVPIEDDVLLNGLKGYGLETRNSLHQFIDDNLDHLWHSDYWRIKVLTEEDEKGKAKYNIVGWGNKKRKNLRQRFSLPDGHRLTIEEIEIPAAYTTGWYAALDAFKQMINDNPKGKTPKQIFEQLEKEEIPF